MEVTEPSHSSIDAVEWPGDQFYRIITVTPPHPRLTVLNAWPYVPRAARLKIAVN
jgi:hypothetical protein